jgi:hypothetical protein
MCYRKLGDMGSIKARLTNKFLIMDKISGYAWPCVMRPKKVKLGLKFRYSPVKWFDIGYVCNGAIGNCFFLSIHIKT